MAAFRPRADIRDVSVASWSSDTDDKGGVYSSVQYTVYCILNRRLPRGVSEYCTNQERVYYALLVLR